MDLHQRRVSASYCVGELGQVKHSEGALLVKDPDGDQSDTGAQVLEGQVKTLFAQVADVADLGVQLHDAVPDVHLWTRDILHVLVLLNVRIQSELVFSPQKKFVFYLGKMPETQRLHFQDRNNYVLKILTILQANGIR